MSMHYIHPSTALQQLRELMRVLEKHLDEND